MAANDYSIYGSSAPDGTSPFAEGASSGASPYSAYYGSSTSSPYSIYGASASSPGNGPSGPAQHLYQDSSQPWYKRAWDWANTPITTSLFGMPEEREGAGGFERGVEHIVSGLTSPLSLALTAATFGTGGLIESAGASALKEAGLSAAEIADAVKGSEAAVKAFKDLRPIEPEIQKALEAGGHDLGLLQRAKELTGPLDKSAEFGDAAVQKTLLDSGKFTPEEVADLAKTSDTIAKAKAGFTPVEDAIREAGADPALYKRADEILAKNGLSVEDLLGGNAMRRGAFQVLRHVVPDLPISVASRAAKTAEFVMNAGFTYQQLEMAAAMSPRFLDALKEGDTDKAWEYGTEAVAGAGLGLLGTSHALHSAGELFKPLIESDKPRLNDQWLAVERANKEREAQHAVAEAEAIRVRQEANKLLGHEAPRPVLGDTPEVAKKKLDEKALTELLVHTGGDADLKEVQEKAAQWHNPLAEAAGIDSRVSAPIGTPIPAEATPSQANTRVLASNHAGEVRIGADGRPVVWVAPEEWSVLKSDARFPEISGVSLSPAEATSVAGRLTSGPVKELFDAAQKASKQNLLTSAVHGAEISLVGEELHHTWQRELAQDGEIINHLDPPQWKRLYDIIPKGQLADLTALGYKPNPVVLVAETAAKFRAGRVPEGVTPDEAIKWLYEYENEVKAKHGDKFEPAEKINQIAKQHVEDINAAREAANRSANQQAGSGLVGGPREGSRSVPRVVPEESGGVRSEAPEEGLASRNEDLRRVYHWSRKPLFTETNPELAGTGVRGAERDRPQIKGTYFGDETYREPMVQGNAQKYYADLDYNKIYDRREDPQGLVQQAIELTRKNGDPAEYNFEKLVKQNGFSGYRTGSVVKSFEPVKVHPDYGLTEVRDPNKFRAAMVKAMEAYAESKDPKKIGLDKQPTIYTPEEYKNMRTFLSPDGKVGFALNGDEIVSAFSHPTTPRAAGNIIDVAVANGGRRLEAFDTFLPKLYAEHGFRAVARMPFNDEFAPDGWNYKSMEKFNGGRPDVVFMVHDPAAKGYAPGDGVTVSGFPEAEALQREALSGYKPKPAEVSPGNGQFRRFEPELALYSRTRTPNPDIQKLESDYTREKGINKFPHEGVVSVNPESAKKIADAYEKMQHNPNDPEVRRAYNALKKETVAQWNAAVKAGYKFEPWTKEGQPYATSEEMAKDVRDNKHLYYFPGGDIPADHPLAGVDPRIGETYNNIFRAVHDLFGHAKNDYEFGPRGEENAFLAHSRMFSDAAIPALLSETKGQNSWVNFGSHLRDENGNVPKKGETGYIPPPLRPYAEQKAGILPKNIVKEATFASPQGLLSRDRENPVWYLKSNQIVDQKIKGPQPADQVLRTLESGGVKPDELKYTGLNEFLRSKGSEKVRPEEIKSFLDASNLQLQEVTHGDTANIPKDWSMRQTADGAYEVVDKDGNVRGGGYTPEEALREAAKASPRGYEDTKFGTYVLPGGSNYREMLLTLPPGPGTPSKAIDFIGHVSKATGEPVYSATTRQGPTIISHNPGFPWRVDYGADGRSEGGFATSDEAIQWVKRDPRFQFLNPPETFRSSHWDEPNVVGHVRFNDRTGPNGEKLLHLEELQSDMMQQMRQSREQIHSAIDGEEFFNIIKRMKDAGELEIEC